MKSIDLRREHGCELEERHIGWKSDLLGEPRSTFKETRIKTQKASMLICRIPSTFYIKIHFFFWFTAPSHVQVSTLSNIQEQKSVKAG